VIPLPLLIYVFDVALLVLDADYTNFMQLLLRYPAPPDHEHRVGLLLRQSLYLRDNITSAGGEYVRQQNALLAAQAGTKSGTRTDERGQRIHRRTGSKTDSGALSSAVTDAGGPTVGELAKVLFEKGEGLGLSRAVLSTLGELRVRYLTTPIPSRFDKVYYRKTWPIISKLRRRWPHLHRSLRTHRHFPKIS
jgi:hypothetical protein